MSTMYYGMEKRTPYGGFDAHEIVPGLFQGSYPEEGLTLHERGFDALVLCARSLQTPASMFPRLEVIHAPNVDDLWNPIPRERLEIALSAAKRVAALVQEGKNVLVTCQAGLNRSGLVSAMALHLMFGWPGARCVTLVQENRPGALFNDHFVTAIRKLRAKTA